MSEPIRNRIKGHRRVRADELVSHELNWRLHPDVQKKALQALYGTVGFARSLLAYELPDGRLKLIDGHLRRDLDPDMEVEVEVLDVTKDEARALLLSIDPLAALAQTQEQIHARLLELAPPVPEELQAVWRCGGGGARAAVQEEAKEGAETVLAQFLVLVTCRDERQQVELLEKFRRDGLDCRALLS